METCLAIQSQPAALELHRLLRDLDPSQFRVEIEAALRARIAEMACTFRRICERPQNPELEELHSALTDIADVLCKELPAPELPTENVREAWGTYCKRLGVAYERLSLRLRARQVALPSLRPTNYARSLVHVSCGLLSLLILEHLLDPHLRTVVPLGFAVFFWFLEGLRRVSKKANGILMKLFRPIAHPREAYQVNSSTWYGTSLALLGLFFPLPLCAVAIAVVAFADPAASLVGRRYGRTKLVGQRSLEGTTTFAVVGTLAGFVALRVWHHAEFSPLRALAITAAAGVAAALAELFSDKLDDNFSVPMTAAVVGCIALWLV